jgi:BT1 family
VFDSFFLVAVCHSSCWRERRKRETKEAAFVDTSHKHKKETFLNTVYCAPLSFARKKDNKQQATMMNNNMTIFTTAAEEEAVFELTVGGAAADAEVAAPGAVEEGGGDDAAAAAAAAVVEGGGGDATTAAAAVDAGDDNLVVTTSSGSSSSSSGGDASNAVVADHVVAKDLGDHEGGDSSADDAAALADTKDNTDPDNDDDDDLLNKQEKNPWSKDFCGIPINYFSVGVIYGGSVSVLYPLLIIQHGVTSSFYAASSSLVTLFWSYKIFFGILCDCFPVRRQKWKPYIIVGWLLCACMLVVLAGMGPSVSPTNLVFMLTFANLGYVMADVAADGMMVWMAHHEALARRGKIQSLIYIARAVGRIFINVVIIFAFSGPAVNCPGYQSDANVPCTTDDSVTARNSLFKEYTNTTQSEQWCYEQCDAADFAFGMTVRAVQS